MKKLNELIDEYLDLEDQKDKILKKAYFDHGARCSWGNVKKPLEDIGLWDDYKKASDEQEKLLGKAGTFWGNFGDDETPGIFKWLKKLMKGLEDENNGS